ncbi:MAG TPA: HAMP domain-containing sensor histidine kinase [Solirubrobacteraceae bacterium]|jgi:signal transduction histidine kinase
MFSALSDRLQNRLLRLPIRVRLATSVALVAFLILMAFAAVIGQINANRQWREFDNQVTSQAQNIANALHPSYATGQLEFGVRPNAYANINNAAIRIFTVDGSPVGKTKGAPQMGSPFRATNNVNGYRVATVDQAFGAGASDTLLVQYGVPTAATASEIGGLRLILFLGALIGTALAFAAGAVVARRAMTPVAQLTAAAAEIERTRDPDTTLPTPVADDEIAELSRTLTGMLTSLSSARNETEAALERQREFVADASHELRTPLTSVLANLELLVDSLRGPDREAAVSALRSTQRMRRLVGDLLLLARADAPQTPVTRERLDLSDVVVEAASELEPAAAEHSIELDTESTPLLGSRDDLQRVATNLIENALRHTPPGTRVTATTRTLPNGGAQLVVADDGPGIAPEARATLFDRFVRGSGDRGGSFGLGLAIVAAVTEAHGGTVGVDESPHGGARFTITLPASSMKAEPPEKPAAAASETAPVEAEPTAPLA